MRSGALGPLSIFLGWLTAVAVAVGIRTFVEYPLLQLPESGAAPAPETLAWIRVGYGALAAAAGGAVTAGLAPGAPLRRATVLAAFVGLTAFVYTLAPRAAGPTGHDAAAVLLPTAATLSGAWLRTLVASAGEA